MAVTAPAPLEMFVALAGGLAVGLAYFGGLRLTLNFAQSSGRPLQLLLVSFIVRSAMAALLFMWIGSGLMHRFALALVGFLLGRFLMVQLFGFSRPHQQRDP